MTESDLFLELKEDGKPVSRLEGTVPRFHSLTDEDIDRIMAALDRDLPMKSTEGLDEVAVESYRRDYKAWRAQLQKNLAEQGVEVAFAESHRRVEVAIRGPVGITVVATIDAPLQLMDAYEHETSFYEDEATYQDPPQAPVGPVERQPWWGEEAQFGEGYYVPREPYQMPQQIEWTPDDGEVRREILVMVPFDAPDEVQGTLCVQARAPDGQSVERVVRVHLKGEWSKVGTWNAEGLAQIGVDLDKEE